ncbi:MAG: phosphodiester glycosidase family protein [Verrucomicrobiota bacterium]
MSRCFLIVLASILFPPTLLVAQWKIESLSPEPSPEDTLYFEQKSITREGASGFLSKRKIQLVWFHRKDFTFLVIDNGDEPRPRFGTIAETMRAHQCVAGSNGGFFLETRAPSGLMIASGQTTGKFGTGGLLSGVLLSSGKGNPYLLRRAEYGETYQATDLIQAGPFLVDRGTTVNGLSPDNSRRRTFVVHDGSNWFGLGLSDGFTLAELGQILASAQFSPQRPIHRALNLDGGTSSGFFVERGPSPAPVQVEPLKTVRNYVGIVPRKDP